MFTIRNKVVSVNIGNYDNIIEDHFPNPDWDFVMFTDTIINSDFWGISYMEYHPDRKRTSRLYKWLIHEYINCEYSLYVDGNVRILTDLNSLIEKYLKDADIAMYRHRVRDCLYEEGQVCKFYRLDDIGTIDRQLRRYRKAKYPKNHELNECEVILRRHTPQIAQLNEYVHNEISSGSFRDQLAFNYAVWKLGTKVNNLDGRIKLFPYAEQHLKQYALEFKHKEIPENINPLFELKEHKCV